MIYFLGIIYLSSLFVCCVAIHVLNRVITWDISGHCELDLRLIKIHSCNIYSGGSPCGENNTYQIYPDNNDDGMIFSSAEINWWVLRILPPPLYIIHVCVELKIDIFTFCLLCTFVSSGCQSRFRKFNSSHVLVRCTLFCKLLVFIVRANLPECWIFLKLKRLIRMLKLKKIFAMILIILWAKGKHQKENLIILQLILCFE